MAFYVCTFHSKRKIIEALSYSDCEIKFQERFGFYPSPELVEIEISKVRPVS